MPKAAICWLLLSFSAAADDELPDVEFLEYLGSWEESDEEWLLFDERAEEAAANEETPHTERAPESDIDGVEQ